MTKINAQHIVDIIQFSFDACAFTAIGEVFRQTCGTSMGNQISPILSTCAIVSTEITWLRLCGQYVASAHLADQLWVRRYVDNRAIVVDKEALHTNPYIWQLASVQFYKKPVQLEDENCDDFLGFRINANNRQVCQRHLSNGYIPMSVFPWLAEKLPSELLRASALTRRGAPTMVFSSGAYCHAGSVGIRTNTRKYPWTSALLTHVDKYNQPSSSNVLVPLSPFRRGEHGY
ncbi:hypothetical protein AK812_SmicGene2105 [Symbiodinium microadriaticum]|uniref:Reverse transcriptase domain-containing protein n=1 Tax=Symbiodinium microadriaticum TaxID=2951 RepID=A0A1Q9F2E1_SYMMI|nr:hypothetical protein AK812_SmicGene2105 [Symbiodinium microadriaticum]